MSFLGGQGEKAFLLLSACGGVKGAFYRQWLVPRHCSKRLQHPYPAPLGRKWRLKAASVAKRLKPSAVQGCCWTVLVFTSNSPLSASADCCLLYEIGKLSDLHKALQNLLGKGRRELDITLRRWGMWLQPEFPHVNQTSACPPGHLGLSYFI